MYMLTAFGGEADLSRINTTIEVVAEHLCKINRWHGATSRLYSVAEHSLHVCDVMEREHAITNPYALLCGLLHDAHEAFTNDMATPVMNELDQLSHGAVSMWMRGKQMQVLGNFNLALVYTMWQEQVRRADLVMLATEARDLLRPSDRQQSLLRMHGHGSIQLSLADYDGMDWMDWRDAFLDRFAELRQQLQDDAAEAH